MHVHMYVHVGICMYIRSYSPMPSTYVRMYVHTCRYCKSGNFHVPKLLLEIFLAFKKFCPLVILHVLIDQACVQVSPRESDRPSLTWK